MNKEPFLQVSKRRNKARWQERLLIRFIALILALIVCGAVIVALVKMNPVDVYKAIWDGAMGSERRIWQTIRDTVRRCEEAGVDPHKHLLLAHDIILSAAVEKYEDTHENRLPVIGLKDTDFVFDEYKGAIIEKDAKKAAAKAKAKYFSQN